MRKLVQVLLFAVVCLIAAPLYAASLDITYGGMDGPHVLWDVILTPDPSATTAVEIGFDYSGGQIVDITPNASVFGFSNPGQNPFTGTVTSGVSIHDVFGTADGAFAAVSGILPSSSPVLVLTIETDGPGSLSLGGHDHNGLFTGARVAQGGNNFDGLAASLDIDFLAADFDRDLMVDDDDLAIWTSSYGGAASSTSGDADGDGFATGADFLIWQRQFGEAGPAPSTAVVSVPEPTAMSLVLLAMVSCRVHRRLRRVTCSS